MFHFLTSRLTVCHEDRYKRLVLLVGSRFPLRSWNSSQIYFCLKPTLEANDTSNSSPQLKYITGRALK